MCEYVETEQRRRDKLLHSHRTKKKLKKNLKKEKREVKIELLFFLSGLILKATRVPMYVACHGNMSAQSYPAVSWGAWLALEGRPALTTFFQYFGGTLEAFESPFFVCMYVCMYVIIMILNCFKE